VQIFIWTVFFSRRLGDTLRSNQRVAMARIWGSRCSI